MRTPQERAREADPNYLSPSAKKRQKDQEKWHRSHGRKPPKPLSEYRTQSRSQRPPNDAEKDLVEYVAKNSPGGLSDKKIAALGVVLDRKPDTIRTMLAEARSLFVENQRRYVNTHMSAVEGALREGQYDVAATHSEWAMKHVSHEGERIIEAPEKSEASGGNGNVYVGVQIGGIPQNPQAK